ncbi:hypothetical protein MMC12_002658 [Toensbergia leucococca]|nr:hypothetical protein [Toensbergia leucococca]
MPTASLASFQHHVRWWNLFEELPPEMVGAYDVVHVRLIALVIKNDNPTVVVKNLCRLLKPGGYLQWEELNSDAAYISTAAPGLETAALEQLKHLVTQPMKGPNDEALIGPRDWMQRLPNTLSAHGFDDVHTHNYCEAPHMALFWTDMYLVCAEEIAEQMLKDKDPAKERSTKEMAPRAGKEARTGAALVYDKSVVVARKAKNS